MAQGPGLDGRREGLVPGAAGVVVRFAILTWVLLRVAVFTVLTLTVFIAAFLGYFTLPFIFVVLALMAWMVSRSSRWRQRLRTWVASRLPRWRRGA